VSAAAPVVGVGGVVVRDGRALLIRRGKPPLLGCWSLPGGAVELGERLEQALEREILEETGVVARPLELIELVDRIEREGDSVAYHYVIADYLCEWLSGEARAGSDALEARFVDPEALAGLGLPDDAARIVRRGLERHALLFAGPRRA
jgi:ADP-ribose pyrophosphatase YjhB (NUDIX family)